MQEYNPLFDLDVQWWLALDEDERIAAVLDYHEKAGIEPPDENMYALLHAVVENQVAVGGAAPTESVLHRLVEEKLDRHDAVHAIASVLANYIYGALSNNDAAVSNEDYYAALEKLTAETWLRGEYSKD